MAAKRVFFFGGGKAEGRGNLKELLGSKGAGLAEMTNLGIPVPPGFTISTEVCAEFYRLGKRLPPGLLVLPDRPGKRPGGEVGRALARLETLMRAGFGDPARPLLVSVRSGARVSMPGMMDTILNLGLNDETVEGLARRTDNPRFAYDSYRRLIQMYGDVVMGIPREVLERPLEELKRERGVEHDTALTADDLKLLVERLKLKIKQATGDPFPQDVYRQLQGAIVAVFRSWENPRAVTYRRLHNIPGDWGTAVNVQAMVFGNMGEDSGTGVAFTRNPSTGVKELYGEFLVNAQGEDVVAGLRTPQPIESLKRLMPAAYRQLVQICQKLERHYRDMQDIEFTIQQGRLWLLQTRTGKRTAQAALRIAVDMVRERIIDEQTAVLRVEPTQIDQLLHPMIDPTAPRKVLTKGLPASPGAAVGKIVFSANEAEAQAGQGEKVILVRHETSPEDIHGMHAAQGILTARGGMTSHAAVVGRGMGRPCVVGAGECRIDAERGTLTIGDTVLKRGDWLTINGTTGEVMAGQVPLVKPDWQQPEIQTFMRWVDKYRTLGVRANADTPADARIARQFGAEGIGLVRTEHMFFEGDRIDAVREMIVAADEEGRRRALAKLLPMQRQDFIGIFREMDGLPVTIRFLDPPLHEFLPKTDREIDQLARKMGLAAEQLRARVRSLEEANPMLGWRGCRLAISYPEILEMQVQAIMEAACEVSRERIKAVPELMMPLIFNVHEMRFLKAIAVRVAEEVMQRAGVKVKYSIGTMIELPRACVVADEIAREAEFFSFGTNDLTQTVMGLSRDDAGKFLPAYLEKRLLPHDPFITIDREGVGALVAMGVERGRAARPDIKLGICGEHGGDPASVAFCHEVGLTYVSASPYRVPVARLAAAHAAIRARQAARASRARLSAAAA
ncbi:MAG TPA: pyruvate, phosphate dikinase, partial [Thermodesulfobacteriota bacterium]|nr:pyruvate, phosphate dikinase [Thermodesulfobacteriota bacterium]